MSNPDVETRAVGYEWVPCPVCAGKGEIVRQLNGGGAGSQGPSDEAQQRPLRGSMPSPATAQSDGSTEGAKR